MYNNRENEYLHIKLLKPLSAGQTYRLAFYARLLPSKSHNHHLQELIGVHFGEDLLDTHIPGDLYLHPQINLELPDSGRFEWFLLESDYIASGGEQYLTLGYFAATQSEELRRQAMREKSRVKIAKKEGSASDNSWLYLPPDEQKKYLKKAKKEKKKSQTFEKPEAELLNPYEAQNEINELYFHVRYYFDDFCLAPVLDDTTNCQSATPPETLKIGKNIELRNVFFETDRAELLSESIIQLKALARILRDHPQMKIEIRGFTDDRGDDSYNLDLSQRRADAVLQWLTGEGISSDRISSRGFGEANPIATNDTEAGRTRNRRVSFYIVNM
jgi:outer membrane protein OmpA-like peptidoglycan-associated protein